MRSPTPSYKILFVTRVVPIPNSTGARTYVFDFLTHLKLNAFELEIACVDASPGGRSPILLLPSALRRLCGLSFRNQKIFNRVVFRLSGLQDLAAMPMGILFHLLPEKYRQKFVAMCTALASIFPQKSGSAIERSDAHPEVKNYPATASECRFVRERIAKFKPDLIIANYAWLAPVFNELEKDDGPLRVILAHDIIHQRIAGARRSGVKWGDYPWTREREKALLGKADLILTIQKDDSETVKQLLPNADVISMPMAAWPKQNDWPQIQGRCLFVGAKGYANGKSLKWFLDEIWPRVLESVPHSHLHVCGTVCEEIKDRYIGVNFLGRVDSLAAEYGRAEVCLAPLLFGTGLKIKIIEALSYSRACVATDIGLQGLNDLTGKAILKANTADEFADAVIQVLSKKAVRRTLELEAGRYIEDFLSPEKVYKPVVDLIHKKMRRGQGNFHKSK